MSLLLALMACTLVPSTIDFQRPGAPNLYWALSSLPRPLIDFRLALETESHLLLFSYPELRELDQPGRGPEHWQRFLDRILDKELNAPAISALGITKIPHWTLLGV